jgi:signal transduction histidine kinase
MKIKRQLITSTIFFGVALLIISAAVITTNQKLSQLNNLKQTAKNIQTGSSDLSYISNDFFLLQENTQLTMWKTKVSSISSEISKLNSTNPQQQTLVNNIRVDLESVDSVFYSVVSFLESAPRNVSVRVLTAFQTAWSRMAVQNQALAFDASVFTSFMDEQANQLNMTNTLLIFGVFGLFATYFLANYIIAIRRTFKSILDLQEGTAIVGSGNLEYRIQIDRKNEIGELANAFNEMATNLKDVTASKTELTKEINERKKAEDSLTRTMDKLVLVNEKLRVVGSLTRHDAQNKLMAVTGNAYLLKKKHKDQIDIIEGLGKMEQAVKQIERIFDFSKAYEKLGVEEVSFVDVERTFNEAVTMFPELNVKFVNDCCGLVLLADSFLRQLFYNLIDNTRKYGKKTSTVRVHYENEEEDKLKLVYEDDGVGISIADKLKLFSEGFSTGGSTGFGLFLIKKMMDVYGWQIQESGEPGKGAKFTITIPKVNQNRKENYHIAQ